MEKNYKEFLKKELEDEEFRKEYESLSSEYEIIRAIINARKISNMTQKELSERSGVAQSDISKLENGNSNPTIKMLDRIASSMDMHLKVEFVPNN